MNERSPRFNQSGLLDRLGSHERSPELAAALQQLSDLASAEHAARLDAEQARSQASAAEHRSTAAAQRQQFLSEASQCLAESIDRDATLQSVARLAVPDVADWCAVDLLQDDGAIVCAAVEHRDADRVGAAHHLRQHLPPRPHAATGPAHVLHTGHTEFHSVITDDVLEALAPEPERRHLLQHLGIQSYLCVPLATRGRTLGTLSCFADADRTFTVDDVAVAEDLGRRAATAIDNARLYEDAQRAARAREETLAIVTHDLRAPLSAIVTAAAMQIATAPADGAGSRFRRKAETIQRAAQHMARLIEDLTDIGQIDAGHLTIAPAEHHADELVRDVVETFQVIAAERQSRVDAALGSDLPPLECDRDRVVQLLSNLVGNALKVGSPWVTIRVDAEPAALRFAVSDAGPGIMQEDLGHMFDRYWRGQTAGYKGSGLGLAIAHGIVTAHHGRIWVESELGVGSTFYVTLPLRSGDRR